MNVRQRECVLCGQIKILKWEPQFEKQPTPPWFEFPNPTNNNANATSIICENCVRAQYQLFLTFQNKYEKDRTATPKKKVKK